MQIKCKFHDGMDIQYFCIEPDCTHSRVMCPLCLIFDHKKTEGIKNNMHNNIDIEQIIKNYPEKLQQFQQNEQYNDSKNQIQMEKQLNITKTIDTIIESHISNLDVLSSIINQNKIQAIDLKQNTQMNIQTYFQNISQNSSPSSNEQLPEEITKENLEDQNFHLQLLSLFTQKQQDQEKIIQQQKDLELEEDKLEMQSKIIENQVKEKLSQLKKELQLNIQELISQNNIQNEENLQQNNSQSWHEDSQNNNNSNNSNNDNNKNQENEFQSDSDIMEIEQDQYKTNLDQQQQNYSGNSQTQTQSQNQNQNLSQESVQNQQNKTENLDQNEECQKMLNLFQNDPISFEKCKNEIIEQFNNDDNKMPRNFDNDDPAIPQNQEIVNLDKQPNSKCSICNQLCVYINLWKELGPVYRIQAQITSKKKDLKYFHFLCIYWIDGIEQIQESNNFGGLRHLKGLNLKVCQICKKRNAGVKCKVQNCKKYYHYHCAINQYLNEDSDIDSSGEDQNNNNQNNIIGNIGFIDNEYYKIYCKEHVREGKLQIKEEKEKRIQQIDIKLENEDMSIDQYKQRNEKEEYLKIQKKTIKKKRKNEPIQDLK